MTVNPPDSKFVIILVTKLDRWFRNIGEYYKVQEILEAHNVSWKTIYEDYDTSTAAGRLKINIMLSVAQDEADRASERIKKCLMQKKIEMRFAPVICQKATKSKENLLL